MKLEAKEVQNLTGLLRSCAALGIENILIEEGFARGVNEDKSCVFISDQNIPSFGANKIGLSRLGVLLSRLNLMANVKDSGVDAKETAKSEISHLEIAGGRSKMQYRCAAPSLVKAPKSVNDTPTWMVTIKQEELELLVNSIKLMGAKRVVLILQDSQIRVECSDTNNDIFSSTLETPPIQVDPDVTLDNSFVHYYPADVLLSVFKQNSGDIEMVVGELGTLSMTASGHPVTVIAQVE